MSFAFRSCFVLAGLLAVASAFADEGSCSFKDFRSKMPPVRNQGDHGWCYAVTAAGLVSYKLGFEVSAADIANATERSKDPGWWGQFIDHETARRDTQDGANIPGAIAAASKRGFCRESDLPLEKSESELHNCPACDSPQNLDQMVDSACKTRLNPKQKLVVAPIQFDPLDSPKAKEAAINAILDNKNSPVGIAHDYTVLTDGDVGNTLAFDNFGLHNGHDSIIVGRRWNKTAQRCEYLVRDSYGPSCAKYYDPKMCEAGNIYVSADRLMNAVQSAYYLP
jgi:hypothetical protein